jgi:hypothetical protein
MADTPGERWNVLDIVLVLVLVLERLQKPEDEDEDENEVMKDYPGMCFGRIPSPRPSPHLVVGRGRKNCVVGGRVRVALDLSDLKISPALIVRYDNRPFKFCAENGPGSAINARAASTFFQTFHNNTPRTRPACK